MRVLVTGASGFFGRAIMRELRANGHEPVGAARRPDGDFATLTLDVTDRVACRRVLASGFAGVVHSAALAHVKLGADQAARALSVNAEGAANIAAAASEADVSNYVFISSVMVYGDHSLADEVNEDAPLAARAAYGDAKIRAERATLAVPGPMRRTILRMATMYAPDWLYNVRKRVAAPVFGRHLRFSLNPDSRRYSLCSRDGGATVVRATLEGRLPAGIYNVADDHVYTQREIRAAVAALEGRALTLSVPMTVPRLILRLATVVAPAAAAEAARSRHWKFCERNVYSAARLAAAGIRLPPQLLEIAARRGGVVT